MTNGRLPIAKWTHQLSVYPSESLAEGTFCNNTFLLYSSESLRCQHWSRQGGVCSATQPKRTTLPDIRQQIIGFSQFRYLGHTAHAKVRYMSHFRVAQHSCNTQRFHRALHRCKLKWILPASGYISEQKKQCVGWLSSAAQNKTQYILSHLEL